MKHTPATPLPWIERTYVNAMPEIVSTSARRGHNLVTTSVLPENATYIAHTANAYPQLVAALREIACERTTHLRSNQMQDCINGQKARAATILRELGEDA